MFKMRGEVKKKISALFKAWPNPEALHQSSASPASAILHRQ